MDTLVFEGKEYVKGAVLAERFRYTADYLGQLCRGKKVDARLVGRAWYINLESLLEHRANRHKATSSDEILPKKHINNYLSRVDVEPILKNKTVKITRGKTGVFSEVSVKYEADEQSLLPRVNHKAVFHSLPVMPAEAETLHVKSKDPKISQFEADALPEISLSGHLLVAGIPEAVQETEIELEGANVVEAVPVVETKPKILVRTVSVQRRKTSTQAASAAVAPRHPSTPVRGTSPVDIPVKEVSKPTTSTPVSFKPVSVVRVEALPVDSSASFRLPILFFLIAVGLSVALLSASAEVSVGASGYHVKILFTLENFQVIIDQLLSR